MYVVYESSWQSFSLVGQTLVSFIKSQKSLILTLCPCWRPLDDLLLTTTNKYTTHTTSTLVHHLAHSCMGQLGSTASPINLTRKRRPVHPVYFKEPSLTFSLSLILSPANWFIAPSMKVDSSLTEQWAPVCELVCVHVPNHPVRMTFPPQMPPVTVVLLPGRPQECVVVQRETSLLVCTCISMPSVYVSV